MVRGNHAHRVPGKHRVQIWQPHSDLEQNHNGRVHDPEWSTVQWDRAELGMTKQMQWREVGTVRKPQRATGRFLLKWENKTTTADNVPLTKTSGTRTTPSHHGMYRQTDNVLNFHIGHKEMTQISPPKSECYTD